MIDLGIKGRMVVDIEKEWIYGHLQPVFQPLAIIIFTLISVVFAISP